MKQRYKGGTLIVFGISILTDLEGAVHFVN